MLNIKEIVLKVRMILRERDPSLQIFIEGNDIIIDGRGYNLVNLFKIVEHSDNVDETIEDYIDSILFSIKEASQIFEFKDVYDKIMPRIQPNTMFKTLIKKEVAHTEWINDCSIVYVIDLPTLTMSITSDQMKRWKVSSDDLENISKNNLYKQSDLISYMEHKPISISFTDNRENTVIVSRFSDGYDSSRIILDDLWNYAYPLLGSQFLAAIPSRDIMALCSIDDSNIEQRFKIRAQKDYKRMPYPITPKLFLVSRDGVSPWRPW